MNSFIRNRRRGITSAIAMIFLVTMTLMALGEHRMHRTDVQNMIYVKLGSAIGCGCGVCRDSGPGTCERRKRGQQATSCERL